MKNYFEVVVKYEKLMQDGKYKKVNEPYLIDALSFTEAEKRINEILEPYISGEFLVSSMKISNYSDILENDNGEIYFKCKISYISIDEEKGTESKKNSYMLVQANDVKEAKEIIDRYFDIMINDYQIPSISETRIQDVFNNENN